MLEANTVNILQRKKLNIISLTYKSQSYIMATCKENYFTGGVLIIMDSEYNDSSLSRMVEYALLYDFTERFLKIRTELYLKIICLMICLFQRFHRISE